jgi:superfamily II DNA/RNA helicase
MSEDLTDYLLELGIRVRYLHSEVDTIRRIELLKELRQGHYDVLVGINLLREGPRPARGQPGGDPGRRQGGLPAQRDQPHPDHRPARPQRVGQVHMYADTITPSMAKAIDETSRGGPSRSPTTSSAASTRSRCARRSPTSWTTSSVTTPSWSAAAGASSPAARRRCRA